jgi:hypothetical protein
MLFGDRARKRLKPHIPRSMYRDLYDKDVVIVIDAKKAIEGIINNKYKNILVYNFWSILSGLLSDSDTPSRDVHGGPRITRTSHDMNSRSAYVVFGTSTIDETFTQHALGNRETTLEGATRPPTIVRETNRIRVRFGRITSSVVHEVGLYQELFEPGGIEYTAMYGRVVIPNTPANREVRYDVVLFSPFVANMASYMLGVLTNTNRAMVDVFGGNYTARTSIEVNADGAYLAIGTGTGGFSFDDTNLTGRVNLISVANNIQTPPTSSLLAVSGAVRLTSAMNIAEIGLLQNLYDTAGGSRPTLLARIVLPTSITKNAGDVFTAVISILAGS